MINIAKTTQITKAGIRPMNEDKVLVDESGQIFGIFDGASPLDTYLSADGKTGAYIAAEIAAGTFAKPSDSLSDTAMIASRSIDRAQKEAGIDLSTPLNRFSTTVAVVRIVQDQAELLQIADSIIMIIYKDGQAEVPLGYHDHDQAVMRAWRKLADNGATDIWKLVEDDVKLLRQQANTDYGLLNGDDRVREHMETTTISLENVATILILSDGMYLPKANPDQPEAWEEYAQLYKRGGLEAIYDTVRELEVSDPDLVKYPRYKLHDDASGIAIDLE